MPVVATVASESATEHDVAFAPPRVRRWQAHDQVVKAVAIDVARRRNGSGTPEKPASPENFEAARTIQTDEVDGRGEAGRLAEQHIADAATDTVVVHISDTNDQIGEAHRR